MSTTPLPSQIDIRKLVVKGAEISARPPISSLPRISDLLAGDGGSIDVALQFYVDDQRFRRIDGSIKGSVELTCQRCLEPVPVGVDIQFTLGVVWSEEDAERLPNSLEPVIVGEDLSDLADIVSEELILGLPFVNYHAEGECQQQTGYTSVDPDTPVDPAVDEEAKENPFNVLEKLKFDK